MHSKDNKQRILTGITTTGTPHLGNYLGAMQPAVEASQNLGNDNFYFMADYHALIKCQDPQRVHHSCQQIAAMWLAMGLDTNNATFYRQSDIPEITQLAWLLTCMTSKGLMNRAHAYKAVIDENTSNGGNDIDQGVTMGLYSYPILMAADILMFNAHYIPVGKDQIQHIEMCRDIAARFNHTYGEHFVLPQAVIASEDKVLSGLDGRKMSKSYNNVIPLFTSSQSLEKLIRQIKTNSLGPGEPKNTADCTLFELYEAFAIPEAVEAMRQEYAQGIAWGLVKAQVFELLSTTLAPARERYEEIIADPVSIETELEKGAAKARSYSQPFMQQLHEAVGIKSIKIGNVTNSSSTNEPQITKNSSHNTTEATKDDALQQAKLEAGKAKAKAIAQQREQEEQAKVQQDVQAIYQQWRAEGSIQSDKHTHITKLDEQIAQVNKKSRKHWQQVRQQIIILFDAD